MDKFLDSRNTESETDSWDIINDKLSNIMSEEDVILATTGTNTVAQDNKRMQIPEGTSLPYDQNTEEQLDDYITIPVEINEDDPRTPDENGFLYSFSQGDSLEIKYDGDPSGYPEWPPHTHNTLETYYVIGTAGIVTPKSQEILYDEGMVVTSNSQDFNSSNNSSGSENSIDDYEGIEGTDDIDEDNFKLNEIEDSSVTIPPNVPHSVAYIEEETKFYIVRDPIKSPDKIEKRAMDGEIIYQIPGPNQE